MTQREKPKSLERVDAIIARTRKQWAEIKARADAGLMITPDQFKAIIAGFMEGLSEALAWSDRLIDHNAALTAALEEAVRGREAEFPAALALIAEVKEFLPR